MSKIRQAFVSPSIGFFKDNFLKVTNLVEYNDIYEPAVFFGAYESSQFIEKHKGYKIILPCMPLDFPVIRNYNKTLFVCSENCRLPQNVIRKSITPRIKDYDMFKPNKLGDKIYVYSGFKKGLNINLTEGSGLSTVIELGLMGRKTIFKNPYTNNVQRMEFPNFITYKTFDGIISIINEESKKINTLQEPIDAHNVGDEWLDLDFWL